MMVQAYYFSGNGQTNPTKNGSNCENVDKIEWNENNEEIESD